jgi:hypothetical protein
MNDAVERVRRAASAVAELVADPAVADRWTEQSVLVGYRVGGLAAHLVRGIETIRTYAPTGDVDDVPLVDASGYYAEVLARHDPVTSEFHARVRDRGERRIEEGHDQLVADAREAVAWLHGADLEVESPIRVLDGISIRTGEYLRTRLVELAIHSDDLALSVGVEPPAFDDDIWSAVAATLVETALRRQPHHLVALALARPERADPTGAFA